MGSFGRTLAVFVVLASIIVLQANALETDPPYREILRGLAASKSDDSLCGPPETWSCNMGYVQARMISAYAALYQQSGNATYLAWMRNFVDTKSSGTTGCGPPDDWQSAEKDHGFVMAAYAQALEVEGDAARRSQYSGYLEQFASHGSQDAGTPGLHQVGNDHSAMVIGYLRAFGQTDSQSIKTHVDKLGVNGCSGLGPDPQSPAFYRCDHTLLQAEYIIGYADGYEATGDATYLKRLNALMADGSNDTIYGCNVVDDFDCGDNEYQALMMLASARAYQVTQNASHREALDHFASTAATAGDCGPPDDWTCLGSYYQNIYLISYMSAYLVTGNDTYLSWATDIAEKLVTYCNGYKCDTNQGIVIMAAQAISTLYPAIGPVNATPHDMASGRTVLLAARASDPAKGTYRAQHFARLDYSDIAHGLTSCTCKVDGGSASECLSGSLVTVDLPHPGNSTVTINITCTNAAGRTTSRASSVTVKEDALDLSFDNVTSPVNGAFNATGTVNDVGSLACTAHLAHEGTSKENTMKTGSGKFTIEVAPTKGGGYELTISCSASGYTTTNVSIPFTVDITPPDFDLSIVATNDDPFVNVTVSNAADTTSAVTACWTILNATELDIKVPSQGTVAWNASVAWGFHNIVAKCNDTAGNVGARNTTFWVNKTEVAPIPTPNVTVVPNATATPTPNATVVPNATTMPSPTPPPGGKALLIKADPTSFCGYTIHLNDVAPTGDTVFLEVWEPDGATHFFPVNYTAVQAGLGYKSMELGNFSVTVYQDCVHTDTTAETYLLMYGGCPTPTPSPTSTPTPTPEAISTATPSPTPESSMIPIPITVATSVPTATQSPTLEPPEPEETPTPTPVPDLTTSPTPEPTMRTEVVELDIHLTPTPALIPERYEELVFQLSTVEREKLDSKGMALIEMAQEALDEARQFEAEGDMERARSRYERAEVLIEGLKTSPEDDWSNLGYLLLFICLLTVVGVALLYKSTINTMEAEGDAYEYSSYYADSTGSPFVWTERGWEMVEEGGEQTPESIVVSEDGTGQEQSVQSTDQTADGATEAVAGTATDTGSPYGTSTYDSYYAAQYGYYYAYRDTGEVQTTAETEQGNGEQAAAEQSQEI